MPTIDDLPAAGSVSDADEFVVSQSDIARRATRAQLLAGVQPALALFGGTLLGRQSKALGAPEVIAVGANLAIENGALNAPPGFSINDLSIGAVPAANDLVLVGQGGENAAVSLATFAAGLAAIPGLDVSNAVVHPAGGIGTRPLGDLLSDTISIESFGAVGDGATDDTAAFIAAFASGRPVRLDSRVYIVNGPIQVMATATILGVAAKSIIQRAAVTAAGAWISILAPAITAEGVIFDAGTLAAGTGAVVSIGNTCGAVCLTDCQFQGGAGSAAGHGLCVESASTAAITLRACSFIGNAGDGLHVAVAGMLDADACIAQGNGGCGIAVLAGINCEIHNSHCIQNQIGIGVGSWQLAVEPGALPIIASLGGNFCEANTLWGVAVAGSGVSLRNNIALQNGTIVQGGGFVIRGTNASVSGCTSSGGAFGIDARSCNVYVLSGNFVSGAAVGVAAGASQNGVISDNILLQNGWAISCNAFEPTLSQSPAGPVSIERNWIGFTSAFGGGISVLDGAQGVSIVGNDINGWGSAGPAQALQLHTDGIISRGNRWNNTAQYPVGASMIAGDPALVFPDTADEILVTSAPPGVSAVLSMHQAATIGHVTFIRVSQGGQGYTQASAVISGSGVGAAAQVVCAGGSVVGLIVTNSGSGYGAIGATAQVTITGDGSGAAAKVFVGLPVFNGRTLRLVCACPVRLLLAGSMPAQQNWAQYDLSVPAYGAVDMVGAFGGWYAVQSPPVDYLSPTGDGGVLLQSVGGGHVILRPSRGGSLCISTQAEPIGCTSSVGRGAPTGLVAAPPGSDFRNLDGGSGNTFWIKCSGTDATGWVCVA